VVVGDVGGRLAGGVWDGQCDGQVSDVTIVTRISWSLRTGAELSLCLNMYKTAKDDKTILYK